MNWAPAKSPMGNGIQVQIRGFNQVKFYFIRWKNWCITPVANLEPVQLAGTIVKRASLYNADQIEKLDVRVGDTVFEKGGEIIPKIIAVDLSKRLKNQNKQNTHALSGMPELVRNEGKSITIVLLWMSSSNYWKDPTLYFEKSDGH
jgi:hypothetical protein